MHFVQSQTFKGLKLILRAANWASYLGNRNRLFFRHGLSKALTYFEPTLRPALKKAGFLTRDSRVVERKKYGRAKARKSFQFSKR
mgnify:CR=1 FL=1